VQNVVVRFDVGRSRRVLSVDAHDTVGGALLTPRLWRHEILEYGAHVECGLQLRKGWRGRRRRRRLIVVVTVVVAVSVCVAVMLNVARILMGVLLQSGALHHLYAAAAIHTAFVGIRKVIETGIVAVVVVVVALVIQSLLR